MGIEPTSRVPQVIECTHLTSPIWAHWAQNLAHFVHCIALRIADYVAVDPDVTRASECRI